MEQAFWDQVVAEGRRVPGDHPLVDLTTELTTMLGDPDPHVRDEVAGPLLATWVAQGVYDDLLEGLGDGMTTGLWVGLGEEGTPSVFRRCLSARVLTGCLERGLATGGVSDDVVLRWGDRVAGWWVRERDLRGYVPGQGWAHAVARGADALGVLARAPAFGRLELTVLLDVVADRLLTPTTARFGHGEDDRLASATLQVLRRDLVGLDVLEPWVARLAAGSRPGPVVDDRDPWLVTGNVRSYLRALHLLLAVGEQPPQVRADLLLVLLQQLR